MCDVDNPLTGPAGAAAVFGPQKGFAPDDLPAVDTALVGLARAIDRAAWVVTGEGAFDLQSVRGKVPGHVARLSD